MHRRDQGRADPVALEPAELEHPARPRSPGGFLKTEPKVRFVVGCVALRRAIRSATVAFTSSAGRGSSRNSTRATTVAGPER
jgi:hypothetical protein